MCLNKYLPYKSEQYLSNSAVGLMKVITLIKFIRFVRMFKEEFFILTENKKKKKKVKAGKYMVSSLRIINALLSH